MTTHAGQSSISPTEHKYFEVKRLTKSASLPTKGNDDDAGWDLYADEDIELWPEETKLISTGISTSFPKHFVGLIWDRSSMGVKGVHRYAGVIDSGYRGEIKVCLHNASSDFHKIKRGDRIAQLLIQEIPTLRLHEVEELDLTDRGCVGFGPIGKK